jgi:hypothetical protein
MGVSLVIAAAFVAAGTGGASGASGGNLTGTWKCCGKGGAAIQSFVITDTGGKLHGHGVLPGGRVFAAITGRVSGAHVTIVTTYNSLSPSYVGTFTGNLSASDNTMSGRWKSNRHQGGVWSAVRTIVKG